MRHVLNFYFFFFMFVAYIIFLKKKIMKHLKLGLITFLFTLLYVNLYSQTCPGNQVTITLQNITNPTSTTIEFDVYISNTGSTSLQLAALQGGVIYSAGMLPTGATGTFTCITQPSATGNFPNFNNLPTVTHTLATRQLRWTSTAVTLVSGNTVNLPLNTPLKFARYKFESTLPWATNSTATLTEQFAIVGGYTQMAATVYCNGNPSSTGLSSATAGTILCPNVANTPYTITLNACATAASQTATTPVTCFGGSNGTSTITMTPTPSSTAITYTVDGGTSQNGTLTSGAFTISGLSSGLHTIVISNTGCTSLTATGVSISQPAAVLAPTASVTAQPTCTTATGTITVTAPTGTGLTYSIDGTTYTNTTGLFSAVAAGTYSVTVRNSAGCTSTATSVTVNTPPTAIVASVTITTQISCFGGNATVTVSATGGTPPYLPTSIGTFTHPAGAYSYTVTDANGCTSNTVTGTISQPAALIASGSQPSILCNSSGTTSIVVTATGGTAPYTGTGSFTHAAGAYSYTVTDANGCSSNATGTITYIPSFDFTLTGGCVDNKYTLEVIPSANSFVLNAATFNWTTNPLPSPSIGSDSTFDATTYIGGLTPPTPLPVTFYVQVDVNGCKQSHSILVDRIYCDMQRGISPNNDNLNDNFDLRFASVQQLEIFNRYGTKVYSKMDYTNEWIGQSNAGEELPDGTYYYVIEFKNNQPSKTGWIYINRDSK